MMTDEQQRHDPATPGEQFHIFATENLDELSARYGSLEAAGERYRWLRDQKQIWERPLTRSEVWWATEPGIPNDLLPIDQPRGMKGYLDVLSPDVVERRRAWLRGSGHASAEEISLYERDHHLLGQGVLRRVT
jgi:hypothetical protein